MKNSLASLVRVMEQAVRDGLIDTNPARITGWRQEYKRAEDELDDPRSLALKDRAALDGLADALVARSADNFAGWGNVVRFTACTAARIGEVSGVRARDIDRAAWTWEICRQTTTTPGGLIDKGTKGKRRRLVPITSVNLWPSDWMPWVATPWRGCSPGRAGDGSPPPSCGTRLIGMRSSSASGTSIYVGMTCGTRA
jgi:integrase